MIVTARLTKGALTPTLLEPAVGAMIDDLFAERILERRFSSYWPGTQLIGHDALVVTVEFSRELVARMEAAADELRQWRHSHTPSLPEDVCLYRHGDDVPTLVSVTHEENGWLITPDAVDLPAAPFDRTLKLIPPPESGFVRRPAHGDTARV